MESASLGAGYAPGSVRYSSARISPHPIFVPDPPEGCVVKSSAPE